MTKKLFSNLLILSLIVQASIGLFAFPNQAKAVGNTYYVSVADGNDTSCTGLASTAYAGGSAQPCPWKTIAKINGSSFVAGDSILFKNGEVWREQLTVPSSGSAGSPITFGAYGATGAKPIISEADVVSTWTADIASYQTTFDMDGWGSWGNYTTGVGESAKTLRTVFLQSAFSGSSVRITVKASAGGDAIIAGASVCTANGGTRDCDATPTRITWDGGNNGTTVTAGSTKVSDPIAFPWNTANLNAVSVYLTSGTLVVYSTSPPNYLHRYRNNIGNETMSQNLSGTDNRVDDSDVLKVEVSSGLANVWNATVAATPNQIFKDKVLATSGASKAALTEGKWYASGTTLSYYESVGNPGSQPYTIEASVRDNAITTIKDYGVIDGLDLQSGMLDTMAFYGGGHNTIQNSTVKYAKNYGVTFSTDAGAGNYVINNDVSYNGLDGIGGIQHVSSTAEEPTYIQRNTVHHNGAYGIQLRNKYYIVENNEVYSNGQLNPVSIGIGTYSAADDIAGTADYNVIRYNLVHENIKGGAGSSNDADGIQIDQRSSNNEVYGNVVYGNDGACITNYDADNTKIYNNTCYGNQRNITGNSQNTEIRLLDSGADTATNLLVKNNTVYATGANEYAIYIDTITAGNIIDITNNDWYALAANWYYWINGGGNNLATWNALTGIGTDLNSDPLYTNAGSNIFTLQSTSPAIDTGVSLGDTYKLGLNPNSVWPSSVNTLDQTLNGLWDIGAYVYTQSTAPTVSLSTPSAGTVSGTITITANPSASSPAFISSVQFTLDGANLNSAVTVAPYSIIWNSASVSDGSHTLSAVATDNYGNTATATPVTVTFHNAVNSGGGPLITYVPPTTSPTVLTPTIPITIVIPTIPAQTICSTGQLFSVTTGLPCTSYQTNATNPLTISPQTTYDFGTATLRFWSKGEAVRQLQMFLNQAFNLNLKVDGILGLKTMAIVKQWQKAHGLVADGVVGAKTKAKMNAPAR